MLSDAGVALLTRDTTAVRVGPATLQLLRYEIEAKFNLKDASSLIGE